MDANALSSADCTSVADSQLSSGALAGEHGVSPLAGQAAGGIHAANAVRVAGPNRIFFGLSFRLKALGNSAHREVPTLLLRFAYSSPTLWERNPPRVNSDDAEA